MKKITMRLISFVLALSLFMGYAPLLPIAYAAEPDTLSVATGNIEAIVSTENGGFLVRTTAGDIIAKDDDNKDLLYRSDAFDTSFTSFRVTEGDQTRDYIFGNNYSFLRLGGSDLAVAKEGNGIKAVWTVDNLTFTQLLEPVDNMGSTEHGTVRISHSVVNDKGNPVSVKARLLLDTALGGQDYAYYELAQSPILGGYDRVEKERVLEERTDYIPANFFAYDDYENPSIAAYTIGDFSEGALRPYRIAFGHWNNLASTVFDFDPDGDLTFTNPYNRAYLTADSAFALYYDLGTVAAGGRSVNASIYYGVDSKVRVKDSDLVGITVTCPPALSFNEEGDYIDWSWPDYNTGFIEVTTNITNLARDGAKILPDVKVAILVDDGFAPANIYTGEPYDVTNKYPHTVDVGGLDVGEIRTLTWRVNAAVLDRTTYRRVVFRAYDMSKSDDGLLLLENLIGSSTAYILCPGRGGLPDITFTSLEPKMVYNQDTRHLYLTGTGFDLLGFEQAWGSEEFPYQLRAYLKSDLSTYFTISNTNIIFTEDEPGVMSVVLKDTMPPGDYQLVFEWSGLPPEGIAKSLTAPALSFMVTTDPAHRNDSYGIVAVVKKGTAPTISYEIKTFVDESSFNAFAGDVLLVLRGAFTITQEDDGVIQACSAVSMSRTDTININGALDFEKGNVQVYRGGSGNNSVLVEFDGDLYTTNSRTAVWSGNASVTPLVDGVDYGLIKYNERGGRVRGKQPQNTISLVWPSGYNMLQTIGGLAVDFRYGQFGAMYENDDLECEDQIGYVVSFGGKLDLSFLMPDGSKQAEKFERERDEKRAAESESTTADDSGLRKDVDNYRPSDEAKAENEKSKVEPAGKVNIEDVLFGKNKGYLGFNSSVEIMLPKYVHALPAMGGKLDINTIGGYAVGVLGKVKTVKFELEFELKVKSAPSDGTPVPDKLFFFMSGFEPGVNIDGAGAVWITGAGGGIDKLYDTIFSSGGVVPLTLLLSTSFDILKVMSGRADLALSLRGFQFQMSNVKFKNTNKVVIDSGLVSTQWSPSFLLQISAWLDLLQVIEGKTYLVVDGDFFEFFVRANVKVPKDIKIVGGMIVSNVDFGGNADKVWGVLAALGIKLGVTYYWGGSVHFGTGANTAKPTYPDLLGITDIPVGVSSDTGETLYLRVGTNLSAGTAAQLVEDIEAHGPVLMDGEPFLKSGKEKTSHVLNLGVDPADVALTITFTGDDRPLDPISAVTITKPDTTSYELIPYDGTNPATANANVSIDDEARTSTVSVTFTEYIAGNWAIATSQAADLVLYKVGALPEVTSFTATRPSDGVLDLDWEGSELDETEISFYVTPDIGNGTDDIGEMGTLIGTIGGLDAGGMPRPPAPSSKEVSFAIPGDFPVDLPSGEYYVRMIVKKEDEVNQPVVATSKVGGGPFKFTYVNSGAPGAPRDPELRNCGNNMFELNLGDPPSGSFDGYLVSIFESTADGLVESDFMHIPFEKEAGVLPDMRIGGTYSTTDTPAVTYGLTGGKSYVAKVAAYRINDNGTPADPADDVLVRSAQAETSPVRLKAATPPAITFEAEPGAYKTLPKQVFTGEDVEETIWIDTFTTNDVSFALRSDVPVSGYWSIDGSLSQDLLDPRSTGLHQVTNVSAVTVSQTLCDGEHTVSFIGSDLEGDSFSYKRIFAVDTMPPRLMLTSPVSGSFFRYGVDDTYHIVGMVTVSGLADDDAYYTILVDGETVVDRETLASLGAAPDPYGMFEYDLAVGFGVSSHEVTIIAEDAAGNSVTATSTVRHESLAKPLAADAYLARDNEWCGNIELSATDDTVAHMQFMAVAGDYPFAVNEDDMIRWTAVARQGSAEIDPDGTLTVRPGSAGYVEGEYLVSEGASVKALATFGAEAYAGGRRRLTLNDVVGGRVTGEGSYLPGAAVELTATPLPGFKFDGWESSGGGTFSDASTATTTFTMPDNDTIVSAKFSKIPAPTPPRHKKVQGQAFAVERTLVSIPLPLSLAGNPSSVVPYYMSSGREVIVPFSDIVDGNLVFMAPVTATFYIQQGQTAFTDSQSHWANDAIDFTVARGLFNGVGDGLFDPDGQMTRAMFTTVLARLDGVDLTQYGGSTFSDIPADSWYGSSVAWASQAGIVGGVSEAEFLPDTPITREQMATMLARYLSSRGLVLKPSGENPEPFSDSTSINEWALEAVELMRGYGIILGKPGSQADPQGMATRAECCTVFMRLIRAVLAR